MFFKITAAGKHRQPGVFFEVFVGLRQLAHDEHAAAITGDDFSVAAFFAEAEAHKNVIREK